MEIIQIDNKSPFLNTVKELGRTNAAKLGFFPDGAYQDYAQRRQILVAVTSENKCVGYLAYRITRNKASIVHLCVDSHHRGSGIARKLVTYLISITSSYSGIGLYCRRDYDAHRMWPKLGFSVRSEKPGRGKEARELTYWWYDHHQPDLFTLATKERIDSRISAVLDANVFYDLHVTTPTSEESGALQADWLHDQIELCVTEEIFNEIDRNRDPIQRRRVKGFAETFTCIPSDTQKAQTIVQELEQIFVAPIPAFKQTSHESDLRQLARAIAAAASFFVTRDDELLEIADIIYERYGVSIVRPADLIIHLDELQREAEYHPARFARSLLILQRVQRGQEVSLTAAFQQSGQGETKTQFHDMLRLVLAHPETYGSYQIWSEVENLLAFFVVDRSQLGRLIIVAFRVCNNALGPTLARQCMRTVVTMAVREGRQVVKINDSFLDNAVVLVQGGRNRRADGYTARGRPA